jgi:hypothetical protein
VAQIKVQWRPVRSTVMVLPGPQETDNLLRDSATRGFQLPGAIASIGQSVGMKVQSELQPDINILYRAYLLQ